VNNKQKIVMCSENTNLAISQNQPTIDREISVSTQTNQPSISIEWSSNGTNTSVLTQSSFHEEIDKNLLKRVIQSSLSSSNTYRDLGWEADDDVYIANLTEKKHLTNILGAIKNGILKTIYYFSSRTKIGRVYVKLSNGFVALRRHIRHILARERYIDIDIENAHPTMISQLFEKECKLLVIPEYVANRNIFFEKISENFNLTELKSALRYAIEDQIQDYKDENDTSYCNECFTPIYDDLHIDHVIHFAKLVYDFNKTRSDIPIEFDDARDLPGHKIFKSSDSKYENEWKTYHRNNAILRPLCRQCNLSREKYKSIE
jgi:hypothetical protein